MKLHTIPVFFLVLFFSTVDLYAKESITIATGEYSPFSSSALQENGYVNHVITRAFSQEGIDVTFKYLPWKRAELATKNGDYSATSFCYRSDEREKHFYYSDTVNNEKTVFFYRKDKPLKEWSTLSDLSDFSIGATIGYTYTKEFWAAAESKKLRINQVAKDQVNMKKLITSRIDLFPAGIVLGNTLLHDNFDVGMASTIDYNAKPLVSVTGHVLFPKASPDSKRLLTLFNKGLESLTESGELAKLYDRLVSGGYKKK
jgi:polar amino acid transport system substrate-binding protein